MMDGGEGEKESGKDKGREKETVMRGGKGRRRGRGKDEGRGGRRIGNDGGREG